MPDANTLAAAATTGAGVAVTASIIGGYSPAQIVALVAVASAGSMLAMLKTNPPLPKATAISTAAVGVVLSVFIAHILGYVTASKIHVDGLDDKSYAVAWAIVVSICMGQIFEGVRAIMSAVIDGAVSVVKFFFSRFNGGQ